jgi:hypothetical protein
LPLITYKVKNFEKPGFEIIEMKTIKISCKDKNIIEIDNYHDVETGKGFQYYRYNDGKVIEFECQV